MSIDLAHLLRLRLAVARFGEMDAAKWWNTNGILGPTGGKLYPRNFPRTHTFARARTVFAVARSRCDEVFNPPGCITLWKLPAEVEDGFETRWQEWLDDPDAWKPFFDRIHAAPTGDLVPYLTDLGLVDATRNRVSTLRRSTDGRGVPLPGTVLDDHTTTLLAAGFGHGGPRDLVVPYARIDV